mmetsp:Transcript_7429/g.10404  ORF Transcript_7429/g.10404 Transcript_7429/m.10404 type:complete len:123 (+) Transcript_7429:200-568(+)
MDAELQVQQPQRGMSMDLAAVEAEEAALLAELGGLDKQLEGQMTAAADEGAPMALDDNQVVNQAEAANLNEDSEVLERGRTSPPHPMRSPVASGPPPVMPKASPPVPKIGTRPAARPPRPNM